MKHKKLILGVMLSCILGLTACGQAEETTNTVAGSRYSEQTFTLANIDSYAKMIEDERFEPWYLMGITPDNFESNLYQDLALNTTDEHYEVMAKGYESWYKAVNDIGYNSLDTLAGDINVTSTSFEVNKDGQLVATSIVTGTKHSAEMVIYITNRGEPTEIGVTTMKSMGEKLEMLALTPCLEWEWHLQSLFSFHLLFLYSHFYLVEAIKRNRVIRKLPRRQWITQSTRLLNRKIFQVMQSSLQ